MINGKFFRVLYAHSFFILSPPFYKSWLRPWRVHKEFYWGSQRHCTWSRLCVHVYSRPKFDIIFYSSFDWFLSSYHFFTVELANTLNDPEGFLIQARSGTDTSSEIIGTFLDPAVVRAKNPSTEVNYKILSCNQSIFDMESNDPLPVSVCAP